MSLLSVVPLWVRLAALVAFALALVGYGYAKGAASVQDKWDLAVAAENSAAVRVVVKQGQITERIVTQYVDRVKVIREAGETIIKEVPVYVPADSPDLPGGFRLILLTCLAASGCSTTTPPRAPFPIPPTELMQPPSPLKKLPSPSSKTTPPAEKPASA